MILQSLVYIHRMKKSQQEQTLSTNVNKHIVVKVIQAAVVSKLLCDLDKKIKNNFYVIKGMARLQAKYTARISGIS